MGIIIKDDKGLVILTTSKSLLILHDIPVGEALIVLSGLYLALKVGFA